jgi:transcription elongation factor SPT6
MVNQAKLQESLDDINVANVNSVGIDINLIVNHEHMQILLSFLSGFGPRKAKNFIQKIKQYGGRISSRGEIYRNNLLPKICYISSISFMKVKIPPEDQGS